MSVPVGPWAWHTCGEIIDVRDGTHDTPMYVPDGVPLITSKNLRAGEIAFEDAGLISWQDHEQIKKRSGVSKGDILYAMIGTIGNPVIVKTDREFSIKNVALFKFVDTPILSQFFYYLLQSPIIADQIAKATQGGLQNFVSLKVLRNLKIPVPPLDEQRRIAAILDEQMAAVEKARVAAQAQLEAAERLTSACLREVFESEETLEWDTVSLGDIALSVQNGIYKPSEYYGHGHPFLRMYNIQNSSWALNLDELAQVEVSENELDKFRLVTGDLLISRVNSFELVGKSAWVSPEAEGFVFENMLIRVRLTNVVDSVFIAQEMNSQYVREQIEGVAKRAIGQASVNSKDIRGLRIRLPHLDIQKHIASMIDEQTASIHQAVMVLGDQLSLIDKLPDALLRRAFSGEL